MWKYEVTVYGSPEFDGYATFAQKYDSMMGVNRLLTEYPEADFDIIRRWQSESVRDNYR